jgi:hypothetical protein
VSGHPHIHVALTFEQKAFLDDYMKGKRGKDKFRVKGEDLSVLRGSWKIGFSDLVICNNVKELSNTLASI